MLSHLVGKHGKKPYLMLNAYDGRIYPSVVIFVYVHTIDDENPGTIIIGRCTNEAVEIIIVTTVAEMTVCSEPRNVQDAHALKDAYPDRF